MSTLEKSIERSCRAMVERKGGIFLKIERRKGWPDRLMLLPGSRLAFVELKRPGEKPTKLQLYTSTLIAGQGFTYRLVYGVDDMKELLDEMDSV